MTFVQLAHSCAVTIAVVYLPTCPIPNLILTLTRIQAEYTHRVEMDKMEREMELKVPYLNP